MLDRRRFLQDSMNTGILATSGPRFGFLGLWGLFLKPLGTLRADPVTSFETLRQQDIVLLQKLMPVAVGLSSPEEHRAAIEAAVLTIDPMISLLSSANRRDLMTLFDLLQFPLTRILLGLWPNWQEAEANEISLMFESWSQSRFQVLRLAYQSTVQILQFAWYSQGVATEGIGYPGPPESIRPYLAKVKGVYDGPQ